MKIYFLYFLLTILRTTSAETTSWTDLRIKYQLSLDTEDVDAFYKIEKTIEDAFENDWIQIINNNDLGLTTMCMSEDDFKACALYDKNGLLAGMQLAIPQSDLERKNTPYNVRRFPVFEMKKIGVSNLREYWTSMILIVSPLTLINGGRETIDTLGEGLWVKNGSAYTEIPTDERKLLVNSPYKKQNCIPTMGTHYFFEAEHRASYCNEVQPYYLLVSDGNVHGLGWQIFGKDEDTQRNTASNLMARRILDAAIPSAPRCLGEWTQEYGLITVQMYFIDEPWSIKCNPIKDNVVPVVGLRRFLLRSLYATNEIINAITRKLRVYIEFLPTMKSGY